MECGPTNTCNIDNQSTPSNDPATSYGFEEYVSQAQLVVGSALIVGTLVGKQLAPPVIDLSCKLANLLWLGSVYGVSGIHDVSCKLRDKTCDTAAGLNERYQKWRNTPSAHPIKQSYTVK